MLLFPGDQPAGLTLSGSRLRTTPSGGAKAAALVALVALAGLLGVLSPHPALAHAELLQASPAPGQQAGGTISVIDLAFMEAVSDAVVEVTHDGAVVPGTMEVANGVIVRFTFDAALSSPGRYDVTYTVTAADQDRRADVFFFTYEPASPPAFPLLAEDGPAAAEVGPAAAEGSGWTEPRAIASLVVVACLCGLAFLYLIRLERHRSAPPAPDDQWSDR